MTDKDHKRYLIIHGHFYQPPRENPWTERIDRQNSASPYHDWNHRITDECYLPNAVSRRLDGYGRILKLVNNYRHISFNLGPTLLSWIEGNYPSLHRMIVEADRLSVKERGGHGNALAQVYNHIIMPLANRRDQETQILWGVRDFQHRFGRDPEGIWLAETAINEVTLEILLDFGFRFLILSPHQADRYRSLDAGSSWNNSADGSIPTGFPYLCYGARRKGGRTKNRSINIFFYDARLSTDVSFNHLLTNGDQWAEAISSSFERCGNDLVTIATDGEIYGHHEPFADMALSYLVDTAAPSRRIEMTNFGAYLDTHPARREVQIKQGINGEGTAWSCSHGLGRWKEDCGCHTGGPPGWNQRWRAPLRESLDNLRDSLASIFDKEGKDLLDDPWKARNDYLEVIRNRSVAGAEKFLSSRVRGNPSGARSSRALSLLESQRNALLMFTSCGWFFNDISGIETLQLLKYAGRAIELAGETQAAKLEKQLLRGLRRARSNLAEFGSGEDLYRGAKKYSSVSPIFLAGQFVITSRLDCPEASPEAFGYQFKVTDRHSQTRDDTSLEIGALEMDSPYTLRRDWFHYLLILSPPPQITCLLKPARSGEIRADAKEDFEKFTSGGDRSRIIQSAVEHFGGQVFALRDLFPEDKEKVLSRLIRRQHKSILREFKELYLNNRDILRLYSETSLEAPPSLLLPAQIYLSGRIGEEMEKWDKSLLPDGLKGLETVISEARYYGVPLDKKNNSAVFGDFLLEKIRQLVPDLEARASGELYDFIEYCSSIGMEIPLPHIQNAIFEILDTKVEELLAAVNKDPGRSREARENIKSFLNLARRCNFNTDFWEERLLLNPDIVV
ncbi:MAG: DUF3536 domain-containing protein [Candidatus Krumholzibacteriota bacterium]|nr:DUF3536 domain-containing protein [Candidatus Krumholzibacteriota bacterium]